MTRKPWFATNARELLQAREEGLMPQGPVVVSLVAGDYEPTTLYARPDMPVDRLDWRMLVNVDVWLCAGPSAALSWVLETASRIAHARPRTLVLRFAEGTTTHDLEVGEGMHLPAVLQTPAQHWFDWAPVNCTGSALGAKLRQALIAKHARWTRL